MARVTERNDWFDLWFKDKQSMMQTMVRNMTSDLDAGYDFFGKAIQNQIQAINDYKSQFDVEMDRFKTMDEKAVNRWCFYDMKKRGVIE